MEITIKNNRNKTDEEVYQNLQKLCKKHPNVFLSPNQWKKLRKIELKKEGKAWSK